MWKGGWWKKRHEWEKLGPNGGKCCYRYKLKTNRVNWKYRELEKKREALKKPLTESEQREGFPRLLTAKWGVVYGAGLKDVLQTEKGISCVSCTTLTTKNTKTNRVLLANTKKSTHSSKQIHTEKKTTPTLFPSRDGQGGGNVSTLCSGGRRAKTFSKSRGGKPKRWVGCEV